MQVIHQSLNLIDHCEPHTVLALNCTCNLATLDCTPSLETFDFAISLLLRYPLPGAGNKHRKHDHRTSPRLEESLQFLPLLLTRSSEPPHR